MTKNMKNVRKIQMKEREVQEKPSLKKGRVRVEINLKPLCPSDKKIALL